MKAIITKYLAATETKPSRIKASAERGQHRIYSNSALEKIQSDDPGERRNLHQIAAGLFAIEKKWDHPLASGGTPNPDVWCHCLLPKAVSVPQSVNEELVDALEHLLSAYAPFTNAASAALRGEDPLHPAVKTARKALERAKPFLHGQELVVAQARTLLAQPTGSFYADGTVRVSAYHLKLLEAALANATGNAEPAAPHKPEPWKVVAVSSNHGNFGHKGVIVARSNGEALELTLQAYGSTPLPEVGDLLDALPTSEVQPRKLPVAPRSIIKREFNPATASDFCAVCAKHSIEVSVARENSAVREAVDGGTASIADIERIISREF